jgi:general secretion pathway protein G
MIKNNKGFTLIELLVVIAIIGLLATLTVASLNSARSKSRDARRVSDTKQLQTALELYLNDQGQYPAVGAAYAAGACLDNSGYGDPATAGDCTEPIYIKSVPSDPSTGNAYGYTLEDYGSGTNNSYTIVYTLENPMAGLCGTSGAAGIHHATPAGICND